MIYPKVSVIIPFNKNRGWLHEAVDSVKKQSYKGEIQLLRSDEVNPHNHFDLSVSENINIALKQCEGEYIKFLAEDDMLTEKCIELSVLGMQEQECDFLHGNAVNRTVNGSKIYYSIPKYPTLKDLLNRSTIHGLTLFYKAEILKKYGLDETLTTAEEYDLNLKLLSKGYKIGFVDSVLGIYRHHDQQKSIGKIADQTQRSIIKQSVKNRYL